MLTLPATRIPSVILFPSILRGTNGRTNFLNILTYSSSIGTQTETRGMENSEERTIYASPLSQFQEKAAFDILTNIFGCLDAPSLCKASRVCLLWKV